MKSIVGDSWVFACLHWTSCKRRTMGWSSWEGWERRWRTPWAAGRTSGPTHLTEHRLVEHSEKTAGPEWIQRHMTPLNDTFTLKLGKHLNDMTRACQDVINLISDSNTRVRLITESCLSVRFKNGTLCTHFTIFRGITAWPGLMN